MTPSTATAAAPRSRGFVLGLVDRFRHLFQELGKFGVVGAVSFVIDFAIYNLTYTGVGYFWAKVLSTTVAATVAFIGNRYWTWRGRERSSLAREYGLYFFFNVVGLGIGLAALWISHDLLGGIWPGVFQNRIADNIASMGFGMALGTLFRFWAYRRFVFVSVAAAVPVATTASSSGDGAR